MLKNNKVDMIQGTASFVDKSTISVLSSDGETRLITATNILVAVGGSPAMPKIPGAEHCISSDGFFALSTQPKSVAVIGGGYIGVELAGVFNSLGTETHLFTRGPRQLPQFDTLVVDTLLSEMKKQSLHYHPNQQPTDVIKAADGTLTIKMANGESFGPYNQIVMATGRKPLVGPLNLEKANVKLDGKGFIAVDEFQCTSSDSVYALGDVCGTCAAYFF